MCSICNGHPDCPCCHPIEECEVCEGTGWIHFIDGKKVSRIKFDEYEGDNFEIKTCENCNGKGQIKL